MCRHLSLLRIRCSRNGACVWLAIHLSWRVNAWITHGPTLSLQHSCHPTSPICRYIEGGNILKRNQAGVYSISRRCPRCSNRAGYCRLTIGVLLLARGRPVLADSRNFGHLPPVPCPPECTTRADHGMGPQEHHASGLMPTPVPGLSRTFLLRRPAPEKSPGQISLAMCPLAASRLARFAPPNGSVLRGSSSPTSRCSRRLPVHPRPASAGRVRRCGQSHHRASAGGRSGDHRRHPAGGGGDRTRRARAESRAASCMHAGKYPRAAERARLRRTSCAAPAWTSAGQRCSASATGRRSPISSTAS